MAESVVYCTVDLNSNDLINTQGELVVVFSPSRSVVGRSPQRACVSVQVVNTFLFFLGIKGDFCF